MTPADLVPHLVPTSSPGCTSNDLVPSSPSLDEDEVAEHKTGPTSSRRAQRVPPGPDLVPNPIDHHRQEHPMNDTQRAHELVDTTEHGDLPHHRHHCVVCGAESVDALPPLPCPGRRDVPASSGAREGDLNAVLADLTALAEKATPGPWKANVLGSEGYAVTGPQGSDPSKHRLHVPRIARCGHEDWDTDKANAALIVAAVNALPTIVAGVEALRAENERLCDEIDETNREWGQDRDRMRARAEAAEAALAEERAKVARVEALAHELRAAGWSDDAEQIESALADPDPSDPTQDERGGCSGCEALTERCQRAIDAGYVKCCPDCSHTGLVTSRTPAAHTEEPS